MTIEARLSIRRGTFSLRAEFRAPATGVTAVFGPSGSGKTSLLRAIAGLDRHPEGYLRVGDTVWQDRDGFVPPHRRAVGYVFQEPALFAHLTVRGNIEYGLNRTAPAERRVRLEQAIEYLGLEHLLDRRPHNLSGGEQRRVAIARALAVSPRLLLMDEPLAGLDASRKQEIIPYLDSLRRELEIPILFVSHSADEVARLADHLALLGTGTVDAIGPIDSMLTRLDLPLARARDAETLINATVSGHDDAFGITCLDTEAGPFAVVSSGLPVGSEVRLRIPARDVSITLSRHSGTSILNVIAATVDELAQVDEAEVMVRLRAGPVPLLARITRKSAAALDLRPGKQVFAQAKSVALLA